MDAKHEPGGVEERIAVSLSSIAQVEVVVRGQTALLIGEVRSSADRARAEGVARRLGGFAEIDNRLTVEPPPPGAAGDCVLEASLESFPASDPPAWIFR